MKIKYDYIILKLYIQILYLKMLCINIIFNITYTEKQQKQKNYTKTKKNYINNNMRINTENNGNCKKGKKTNSHYYNMKKNHVLFKIF